MEKTNLERLEHIADGMDDLNEIMIESNQTGGDGGFTKMLLNAYG